VAGRRAGRAARAVVVLALLAGGLVAAGCGDDITAQADAAVPDAPVLEDASPQNDLVVAPGACEREYQRCEDAGTGWCQELGLECVSVRVDTHASVCLRRCGDTKECPFNSYCVPKNTDVEFGGLKLAAQHCFGSVCGNTYGNGELFGACSVGGENLVNLAADQQRPGTCIPIDTDAGLGACAESGLTEDGGVPGAPRGGTCTLDMVQLACPGRTSEDLIGCVSGTTCIGVPCDSFGSCALLCDPRLDPEAQCAVTAGNTKQYCQDISLLTLGASGKLHLGYVGVCQENLLCKLFATRLDGGAPAAGCAAADECYPTTMATTNGVCFQAGTPAVGEACQYLNNCVGGAICVGPDPCDGGTCERVCPLPDDGTCGTGQKCAGVALDNTQPAVFSIPWGTCVDESAARSHPRPRVLVRPTVAGRR
jgi:hypothetical protein